MDVTMTEKWPRSWGLTLALSTGLLANYLLFSSLLQ